MKIVGLILSMLLLSSGVFRTSSSNLSVVNNTSNDLGTCTLSGGASIDLALGPNTNLVEPIDFTVDSITIEGQTVIEPSIGPVKLSSGASVAVQWPSTNYVEIYDYDQGNSPLR